MNIKCSSALNHSNRMTCRATGLMWLSLRLLFILLSDSSPSPPSWPPMRNHTLCSSLFTSPSSSSFSSALVLLLSINLNPPSPSPLWTEEGGVWMDGGMDVTAAALWKEKWRFLQQLFFLPLPAEMHDGKVSCVFGGVQWTGNMSGSDCRESTNTAIRSLSLQEN